MLRLSGDLPGVMGTGHPKHLSGLAPGGVYLAADITTGAGGLLHHRFTLAQRMIATIVAQYISLWHLPSGYPAWSVNQHHALRSADFPQEMRRNVAPATAQLTR